MSRQMDVDCCEMIVLHVRHYHNTEIYCESEWMQNKKHKQKHGK